MAHPGGRPYARLGHRQDRGRGSSRGARGGRGGRDGRGGRGGKGPATTLRRADFRTSRVQDIEDDSETEEALPVVESEDVDEDDDKSLSASEDEASTTRQSYAALLQALKAERTADEPARKRRKTEPPGSNGRAAELAASRIEKAEDHITEEDAVAALTKNDETQSDNETSGDEGQDSDDESVVLRDPFELHFARIGEEALKEDIAARQERRSKNTMLPGQVRKQALVYGQQAEESNTTRSAKDWHFKARLHDVGTNIVQSLTLEEKDFAGEVAGYRDVQYGKRTTDNTQTLREISCLHALNHVFKTRDRVLKNNAKLSQDDGSDALDLRDQGFTRPKVLVIVPTKQACARFIDSIVKICQPDQQENKSRFIETYSQGDDDALENKPDDFRELFGGNHEEDFRVGLKFTRKTIKYFSGFYNSDIIFGSALGLMRTITTGGGGGGGKDKKKGHDADFLSSIEIVVVDHAAAIQMQNFQHLEYVFTQLNQLPKDSHGCDFARVRHWYLDGNAKYLRQTILLTAHHTPELNSLFSNHTFNVAGASKYTPTYAGSMLTLPASLSAHTIPQTFLRFDSPNPQTDSDARFKFFTTTILPPLLRHNVKGVLVFIPTYFDFVRLRNHLSSSNDTTSLSFGSLSEYTSVRDTARARSHFVNGRHSLLVYSERAHHHFRYRIKGVKRIVFYGVPENPLFWAEIVGLLGLNQDGAELEGGGKGGKGLVRALFSRWDVLKLERIVGTDRVGRLIHDRGGDTFEFV